MQLCQRPTGARKRCVEPSFTWSLFPYATTPMAVQLGSTRLTHTTAGTPEPERACLLAVSTQVKGHLLGIPGRNTSACCLARLASSWVAASAGAPAAAGSSTRVLLPGPGAQEQRCGAWPTATALTTARPSQGTELTVLGDWLVKRSDGGQPPLGCRASTWDDNGRRGHSTRAAHSPTRPADV